MARFLARTFSPVALLAGCSGGGSGGSSILASGDLAPQDVSRGLLGTGNFASSHSVLRPGFRRQPRGPAGVGSFGTAEPFSMDPTIVVVSDAYANVVYVVSRVGYVTLSHGFLQPQGLSSDMNGDLFIADTGNHRIVRYAAGFQGAPTVTADPGQYPTGVDTFSNGKWLAAANISSEKGGPGSVTIYKDGTSIGTVSSSSLASAYFCAFDATGNLFVSGIDRKGLASVGEIENATSGGALAYTELTTSNRLAFPGGIQVTTAGSIVYDDQGDGGTGSTLYTYMPPANGSLGSPTQTTHISEADPSFAFTRNGANLYDAACTEYSYPAGTYIASRICSNLLKIDYQPVGVAVVRTQYPKT